MTAIETMSSVAFDAEQVGAEFDHGPDRDVGELVGRGGLAAAVGDDGDAVGRVEVEDEQALAMRKDDRVRLRHRLARVSQRDQLGTGVALDVLGLATEDDRAGDADDSSDTRGSGDRDSPRRQRQGRQFQRDPKVPPGRH